MARTKSGAKVHHVCAATAVLSDGRWTVSEAVSGALFIAFEGGEGGRVYFVADSGQTSVTLRANARGEYMLIVTEDGDLAGRKEVGEFRKGDEITFDYGELFGNME